MAREPDHLIRPETQIKEINAKGAKESREKVRSMGPAKTPTIKLVK
jgi:hypothetical protein